ncbi:MAG: response regulator [Elusimicrobia bacterium]|nr:response regulator [Elusimicrobiota bacterium]
MKRILVVDDDRLMVEFISLCLERASYSVETAFNGVDGLAKAKSFKPDLLVLDLMMPDMHGFDVCEELRREGGPAGLKILISSGKSYEVDKKAAKRLGADGFITKPFTIEQLMAAVDGLLAS